MPYTGPCFNEVQQYLEHGDRIVTCTVEGVDFNARTCEVEIYDGSQAFAVMSWDDWDKIREKAAACRPKAMADA